MVLFFLVCFNQLNNLFEIELLIQHLITFNYGVHMTESSKRKLRFVSVGSNLHFLYAFCSHLIFGISLIRM